MSLFEVGKFLAEPEEKIDLLLNDERFFLGGSRWFKTMWPQKFDLKPSTDWDFNCQDTEENRRFLESHGFMCVNQSVPYVDDLTTCIFIRDNIQVVLRSDIDLYTRAFYSVTPEFYVKYLWKSGPNACKREDIRDIMNQLFAVLGVK